VGSRDSLGGTPKLIGASEEEHERTRRVGGVDAADPPVAEM
jgi:hypothetical protein